MPVPAHDLEPMIRAVERDVDVDATCQVLVTIDTRNGQPVKKGWRPWGRATDRSFLVTNTASEAAVAVRRGVPVQLADFAADWIFELWLDYEARCPPGHEERLAAALWAGPNPQERLDSLLRGWIRGLLSASDIGLVSNFESRATQACEALRLRALEEIGVVLAARLRLELGPRLETLRIDPLHLPVRVRDWDGKFDLEISAEFPVRPEGERLAYLSLGRQGELRQKVQQAVGEYFAEAVTLHQFHTELQLLVKSGLGERLDSLAAAHGRRLGNLSLAGHPFDGVIAFTKIEHEFDYQLAEYPKPVHIKIELLVELVDLGRYARAGRPDLAAWARGRVEKGVEKSLFGITYSNLGLNLEEKKAEIEGRMRDEAAAIGYELKQLITITDLEFDILRRPFTVSMEGEFPTRLANLKVRLAIEATLRIDDPRQVAEPLNRRQDVRQLIRDTVENALRQKMHTVEPENFYMAFEVPREGGLSVRRELEAEIRQVVGEEFHADLLSVSCKQLETEISGLLARLMTDPCSFEITAIQSTGGPPVEFEGSFRVLGVDHEGWATFQTSLPGPEKLIDCSKRHIRQLLADFTLAEMLRTTNAQQRAQVDGWVRERICREFGLAVEVMDWMRRPSELEELATQARIFQARDTIEEQIALIQLSGGQRKVFIEMQLQEAEERAEKQRLLEEELSRRLLTGEVERERELRAQLDELQERQSRAFQTAAGERSRSLKEHLTAALAELTDGDGTPSGEAAKALPSGGD